MPRRDSNPQSQHVSGHWDRPNLIQDIKYIQKTMEITDTRTTEYLLHLPE